MARPRLRKIMRVVHHWTSLAVLLTGGLVAVTGVLLLLKKDVDWLQPPVSTASRTTVAAEARVDALFDAASGAAPRPLSWNEIDRIDLRPADGIAKVITEDAMEYQVDLHTLEVLSIAHRGSDIVEKIHDGSFFSSWVKYFLMLPAGVALFVLWFTGVYLFFLTQIQKWRKGRR